MARIGSDEIERIKAEMSQVRLVESSGVKLAKCGGDMVGAVRSMRMARPRWSSRRQEPVALLRLKCGRRSDRLGVGERPNAKSVIRQLPNWFRQANTIHPYRELGYLALSRYVTRSTSEELSEK